MSCSNYYRMFFALTGYSVKEYIRHRRISCAVKDIRETDNSILNIALKYGFESNEAGGFFYVLSLCAQETEYQSKPLLEYSKRPLQYGWNVK